MPFGAYYADYISGFLASPANSVIGALTSASEFAVTEEQRDAWREQIQVLKSSLAGLDGRLFLEFKVPRIGSRIDAVVITGATIFVIEFKVGSDVFSRADLDQAWD